MDVEPERAQRTLELTGLDRVPGHPQFSDRDRRWQKRFEAWGVAIRAAALIEQVDTEEMRSLAIEVARARGFWSIWLAVFRDDIEMCRRLIAEFPGTASDCFDETASLLPRPGGAL